MLRIGSRQKGLGAAFALVVLAACTQPTPQAAAPAAPRHDAATSGPELAGAWYQVYFDTGSAEVNARGAMIARTVATVVNANPDTRVTLIGRTDRIGAPPANLALAERRANAVRDALVSAGVPPGRIDTSWSGEARQPVARQDDPVDARTRVVDVTVVKLPQ